MCEYLRRIDDSLSLYSPYKMHTTTLLVFGGMEQDVETLKTMIDNNLN